MPSINLTIKNDLAEFKKITRRVIEFLDANQVHDTVSYFIRVAIEELVVNAIHHAFDDDEPHDIEVGLVLDSKHARVRVEDDGRPFDPRSVPDPELGGGIEERQVGGWGIYLVRSMSNDIAYERDGDRNRVVVTISLEPPRR